MPRIRRATRIGFYHLVIAKSVGDAQLFFDDSDYDSYLQLLRQMVRDKNMHLYAFCLQRDEVRLVIKPLRMPIARIMQRIHCSHTLRINKRRERRGHLFSGRFRSIVFAQQDLCSVVRAVHLWPVRIGNARRAESYRFGSHAAYVTLGDQWADALEMTEVLSQFAGNVSIAQRAFMRYVESAALEEDDFGVPEGLPGIGGESDSLAELVRNFSFHQKAKRRLSLTSLAKRVGLLLNVKPNLLFGPSRRQDLVVARRLFATAAVISAQRSITEVAEFLQRDKAQISRLVSQGMDLIDIDEPFRTLLESIRGKGAQLAVPDAPRQNLAEVSGPV